MILFCVLLLFVKFSLGFQEIFTLDCQRRAHITPYLPTAMGIDMSGVLSILNAAFDEMFQQSQVICEGTMTDEEFNARFGITLPQGLARLFENDEFPEVTNACKKRYHQEISVVYEYIKAVLPENPLPPTCDHTTTAEGICHFALNMSAFTLQFAFEECPVFPGETIYNRIPFVSVTCEGCDTFLKPCVADTDCGDFEVCDLYKDYLNQAYFLIFNETFSWEGRVFNEKKFFDFGWFDDLLRKEMHGFDFVTDFFKAVGENYWGSSFTGPYSAYQFCFPDIRHGSDLFLNQHSIVSCDDSEVGSDLYCDGKVATDPLVCSNHGTCMFGGICDCEAGWEGLACEAEDYVHYKCNGVYQTYDEVCSFHGTCGDDGVCYCDPGWTGNDCQDPAVCYDKPFTDPTSCGDYGTCTTDGVCECMPGHYTADSAAPCGGTLLCNNVPATFIFVCSENGLCMDDDNGNIGKCLCDTNHTGINCQDTIKCWDKGPTDSMVCTGRGECIGPNLCVCEEGTGGPLGKCEVDYRQCFGVDYDDDAVCFGHGDCVPGGSGYECICDAGWELNNGDCLFEYKCGGHVTSSGNACNGNGICIDTDVCLCDYRYTGTDCGDVIECNGVGADLATVCSGYGICTIDGVCECDAEHRGFDCGLNISCGGMLPTDPDVCDGVAVCTATGCRPYDDFQLPNDPQCTSELLGLFEEWDGTTENGDCVSSPSRRSGQNFPTQINRVRMEYKADKPIPLYIYNGDGVHTVLPSHQYLGFAVYIQELDRLLVLLDELFTTLRSYHSDLSDVSQKYYFKYWDPLPWLFRFTTYNMGNHLKWRRGYFSRQIVRFLNNYELPNWWKLIEPPTTCTVPKYRDEGVCTMKVSFLRRFFGGDIDLYFKFRRDEKDGPEDYTGFPHMEVWCDGALCHEMYQLKECEDNEDCESKICRVVLQTHNYRESTYVTPFSIYYIEEADGTSFVYNVWKFSALFFEGSWFRMDFADSLYNPITFFRNMLSFISGREEDDTAADDREISICTLEKAEGGRLKHGKHRFWFGTWFGKFRSWGGRLFRFKKYGNWWEGRRKWWKRGGFWRDDDDDDDNDDKDDDNNDDDRRRKIGWGRFWKNWKNKKNGKGKHKKKDEEYGMFCDGIEEWEDFFCMKRGGESCGCYPGMLNCVCYEFADAECSLYFDSPQSDISYVPGEVCAVKDDVGDGSDDTLIRGQEAGAGAAMVMVTLFLAILLF